MLRRVVLLIVAALGLLVLQQASAQAADFTVNNNGDQPDAALNGTCATAGGGVHPAGCGARGGEHFGT